MGGQVFVIRSRGSNINEAYRNAIEEAIAEHGNDAYNGTISTTISCIDVTKKFRESKKERRQFLDDMIENARKRDCYAIEDVAPIKNNNKKIGRAHV